MRFTTFYKFLMIAPLSVALGWTQQSSLGEIAKQGKTSKKAKIVITDDDVVHSTAVPAAAQSAASGDSTAGSADAKAPADGAPDAKPKGATAQQSKDPKVNELRQKVDKLKAAEEMYKGGLKAGQDRLGKATTDFERETAQEIINNQTRNVQMTQEKLRD